VYIFQYAGHPLSLTEYVFGQEEKRIFWAGLYTAWIPVTEIAFKRCFDLLMQEDSAKRTGSHALLTGDAFFIVNIIDTVLRRDGSSRTILHAFGDFALSADDGHPYDGMRIDDHHPNCALFGVIHAEAIDGTDQFANLASGTTFRDDSQLPRHLLLLALCFLSSGRGGRG